MDICLSCSKTSEHLAFTCLVVIELFGSGKSRAKGLMENHFDLVYGKSKLDSAKDNRLHFPVG